MAKQKTKLSGQQKVQKALLDGKTLTPAQIRARYGLKNPHQQVFYMEDVLGMSVKREYKEIKRGNRMFKTVKYSMV